MQGLVPICLPRRTKLAQSFTYSTLLGREAMEGEVTAPNVAANAFDPGTSSATDQMPAARVRQDRRYNILCEDMSY